MRRFVPTSSRPTIVASILDRTAALMEMRASDLVEVLRKEAGFPRRDAMGEIQRCANTFRLSAEEARNFSGEVIPVEGAAGQAGRIGFTLRVPLGVVGAITPFKRAAQHGGPQGSARRWPPATRWC